MNQFSNFIKNASWVMVFDALILVGVLATILFLTLRKRNVKLAICLIAYFVLAGAVTLVSDFFDGKYLFIGAGVLRYFTIFVIVAVAVIYQTDLKTVFLKSSKSDELLYHTHGNSEDELIDSANEIIKAVQIMSKSDTGALIIMCPDSVPTSVVDTGTKLNCLVSNEVLQAIFNKKSPLHDGAVVIKNNTIIAAGCFLPLTQRSDLSRDFGTRHRAAIGVTEEFNVVPIVVSEESGIVSVVHKNGDVKRFITGEKLLDDLAQIYGISVISRIRKRK